MGLKRRICVITAGHLATCPRMVKAAGALAEAGHYVRVISAQFLEWAAEADRPLAPVRWSAVDYRLRVAPAKYWRVAAEFHAARRWIKLIGPRCASLGALAAANGRAAHDLLKRALREPADLFYGGTRGGLAIAALAARRAGVPFGVDLEDFHEGESPGPSGELIRQLQRRVLPRAAFVTAGSCAIASRYEADYAVRVLPIHNTFPLPAQAPDPEPPGNGALRLYWFGQTIGADRGLEDVVRAIEAAGIRAELHLRGAGVFTHRRIPIHIHPPAPPEQMIDLCRPYDVGLSPEAGRPINRELCLSNKALTYILGGLAVVLTDTAGQRQFGCELGEGALRYRPGDVPSLAAGLKRWAQDRAALRRAREAAWNAARNRWHWEHRREKGALVAAVEGAFR
ncbi:MAG TPA: glycosyltransferase [Bryobacteraceae bacterium]|nr:glycosyltransferase [Bryobacteraceae bacterium]